ncbi:hypothetical protein [Acinetobacter chengduensis]|uniref:Uncharacterized protein n=1 Tax=Acinetobacter chengduensis TaxID=2420890 RepID=A0ABX9TSK2_9GAMM|nr:hypothetical protein [Acinetobacter chengduensis]RLL18995.1 hypothetical protein D9K81_14655 [Acinetobacter chengduensis]
MNQALDFSFITQMRREKAKNQAAAQAAKQTVNHFDSAAGDMAEDIMQLDDKALESEILALRRSALYGVLQLADDVLTDDLDDSELPSDRLDAYLLGGAGEGGEEHDQLTEQVLQIKAANMADAMSSLGVDDDTIEKAFGENVDEADEAIEKIAEIISTNLPAEDERGEFITAFIFGDDGLDMEAGQVAEYDSAQVGKTKVRKTKSGQTLVYRGVKAVRAGKVTVVNKRIGNTSMKVKLSAKQKNALRKASAKAVSPNAIKRRLKSLQIGKRQGIYKKNNGL